jgi:hypothetical protein
MPGARGSAVLRAVGRIPIMELESMELSISTGSAATARDKIKLLFHFFEKETDPSVRSRWYRLLILEFDKLGFNFRGAECDREPNC